VRIPRASPTGVPVVALQFAIATGFALLTWNLGGVPKAWSAAYGGAIAVIGSLMYAMIVARGSNDAKVAFRAHVRAEVMKIFITVVLFVGTSVVSVGRMVMADLGFRGGNLGILVLIARNLITKILYFYDHRKRRACAH
jgi:F0F1-type ATP synthase assembly protein I